MPSNYRLEETGMQNAHERFGTLEVTKRTKDTTTRVRAYVDRVVLEAAKDDRGQADAHLISMIGRDAEIGALWAAIIEGALNTGSGAPRRASRCLNQNPRYSQR